MRSAVDAGVVDDRVHRAEPVDVAGDVARLVERGKVADDDGAAADEVVDGAASVFVSDVDDDLVPGVEQRLRGRATEAVGGARDEDSRHRRPYLRHQRLRERCPSFARDPVLAQWLEADVVCSGVEVRVHG